MCPDYIAGAASDRDENHPAARQDLGALTAIGSKKKKPKRWKKEERDPRTRTGLGGAGGGGKDPRPDEVGEEAGEGEQEGVVHRDEQRRGSVAPVLGRLLPGSGAELIGLVHLAFPPPFSGSGDVVRRCGAGWVKRPLA